MVINMTKLLVSLLIALCLLLPVFSGCGGKEDKKENPSSASSSLLVRATPSPVPVQKAKAVRVKADDGLNIRSAPATEAEILGLADKTSYPPLMLEPAADGAYQVEYEGKTAYVSAEFAEIKEITLNEYNKLRSGNLSSQSSSEPVDDDPGRKPTSSLSSQAPLQSSSQTSSGAAKSSKDIHDEDGE